MPLHPQARAYLDAQPPPSAVNPTVQQMREGSSAITRFAGPGPELAEVEDRDVGGVPCRIYRPLVDTALPTVVHIHGGGWVGGDLDTHDTACRMIAAQSGWNVVAVDYRLSPEHPFPAPMDDIESVAAALRDASVPGVDGTRLALLGDSAGGHLAAVVARRARDAGLPPYLFQGLIYPVIDAAMAASSYTENADGYGLLARSMAFYWDCFAPDGVDRTDPDVSPAEAKDLSGLPPAFVLTCEYDPLRDEGESYAAALADAGVPTVAIRVVGMIHSFFRLPAAFDASRAAISQVSAMLADVAAQPASRLSD
ncbi:MAG: alpha/beta hydrolase [Geodermatophilaceae bacterium]|nr:alpha/beta hydrolase [Geodermatophilaceae bacterium]